MPLPLPYYFEGKVVRGYGRGGKELGCPTANMDENLVAVLPMFQNGVYYGFAQIYGKLYSMAMSLGTNPQYNNGSRSMEIHVIGYEGPDFYNETLKGLMIGFIRKMDKYESLDALKEAIAKDISYARMATRDERGKMLRKQFFPNMELYES
ncbi:unnamed protein product [Caenorhabditis bovis]|uniref:riboflavin kinase n=1 Tax=Caenorhabditis bovis TaxID=2654633 RepID=A0A8S1FB14_9PELO|nr:unnamed protein product [Caenorhabditis bovis]